MNQPFIFTVDLDGCVADYFTALRAEILVSYPNRRPHSPPTTYDFSNDPSWGFETREDFLEVHNKAVVDGMFLRMAPIIGASDALWSLSDQGVHIRILTHRFHANQMHAKVVSDTVTWLDRCKIPYRSFCVAADKTSVDGNIYIEDSPSNIQALQNAGKQVIVFNQPYNQDAVINAQGWRAKEWIDVEAMVSEEFEKWRKNA